jgi:hypothetical protein
MVGIVKISKQHLQIRIPPETYVEMEKLAEQRGFETLSAAGRVALENWIREGQPAERENPSFGPLTKREERILRGLLAYMRDESPNPDRDAAIEHWGRLAKRYR